MIYLQPSLLNWHMFLDLEITISKNICQFNRLDLKNLFQLFLIEHVVSI